MPERKYSVEEIDKMRNNIFEMCTPPGVPYYEDKKIKEVEERLRTYMLNGTDPDEVEKAATELKNKRREQRLR